MKRGTAWKAPSFVPAHSRNSVIDGSPAAKAGLKKGDIVVKLANKEISGLAEFRYELYKHKVGDKLSITYYRDGKEKTTTITLGKSES